MRTSSFSRNHPYAKTRGWVSPKRAASSLPTITDGVNEVDDASEIWVLGGTVSEPEEGVAQISFGGQSIGSNSGGGGIVGGGTGGGTTSGALPVRMYNNSGLVLIPGDVVVTDPTQDSGVTTTATASNTRIAGVVQAPINAGDWGPVLFNGFTSVINTTSAVTRGNYALTSTTPKMAGSTASRVAGSFAVYLTGAGDFPNFVTAAADTNLDTPSVTLDITMPASIPAGRTLFLALWLESGVSAVDVDGWTLIGAEAGYYYYTRASLGDDTATATWTGASTGGATVLLLNENVSAAAPIEDHDYDSTTSAATVTGLDTAIAHYAIAGVQASAASIGSGFVRLGSGAGSFDSTGGTPTLVQSKFGTPDLTFDSTLTTGNVMITVPFKGASPGDRTVHSTDPRQGGTCPQDANMTKFGQCDTNLFGSSGVNAAAILGKVISGDTYSGPFGHNGQCDASSRSMLMLEFENIGISDYEVATLDGTNTSPIDLGTFTVGANDVVIMALIAKVDGFGGSPDPVIIPNGFTEIHDGSSISNGWEWAGYKVGDGDASVSYTNIGGGWAAIAVKLTQGTSSAAGTLAGKYIGHDSSATSPFTGGGAQNDAIFAFNLLQDAKASALLYGPDLGGSGGGSEPTADTHIADTTDAHDASAVSVVDSGGYFTGTDVEAALQELGADVANFNVRDFGAVGDGSTDDTSAIQDTVDAATTAGGGVIYFPPGHYIISGALQDTGSRNAQIIFPDLDVSTDQQVTLHFKGALKPEFAIHGPFPSTDAYSIIESTLTGASGTAAVFGGLNGTYPTQNNVQVVVEDLICLAPDNPTFTFWNLSTCQGGSVRNVLVWLASWANPATAPTHSNAYGVKLPQWSQSNYTHVNGLMVACFYTGVLQGELAICRGLVFGLCVVALELPESRHSSLIVDMHQTGCTYGIRVTGTHACDILQFSTEHYTSPPLPSWTVTVYDLDDPSDELLGYIRWYALDGVSITPDHIFNVNGGANVEHSEVGTPWSSGAVATTRWELAVVPGSPPDSLYADGDWLYIEVPV